MFRMYKRKLHLDVLLSGQLTLQQVGNTQKLRIFKGVGQIVHSSLEVCYGQREHGARNTCLHLQEKSFSAVGGRNASSVLLRQKGDIIQTFDNLHNKEVYKMLNFQSDLTQYSHRVLSLSWWEDSETSDMQPIQ